MMYPSFTLLPIFSCLLLYDMCPLIRADFTSIAGYHPLDDVSQHALIDLDMESCDVACQSANFTEAYRWYSQGGNSIKSSGSTRTIQQFSTDYSKLVGEKWYDIFAAYWSDPTYADTFTANACQGKGDFTESTDPIISDIARAESCTKGAQYQNIWMYVVHEMEASIKDCRAGVIGKHWDEAVAFYTGSIPGTKGDPSGVLQYALAEKRCLNFGTCNAENDDDGTTAKYQSTVNQKVFELFEKGRDIQLNPSFESCNVLESTKESLVQQFTIPLLQGVLRYLYLADLQESEKSRSELWAFSAAVLPILDYYDTQVATKLRNNAAITNTDIVPDGYAEVKYQLETLYSDLGMTCADVGGLVSTAYNTGYFPGMAPCVDASTSTGSSSSGSNDDQSSVPIYGVAIIVIVVALAMIGIISALYCYNKSNHFALQLQENENEVPDSRVVMMQNQVSAV